MAGSKPGERRGGRKKGTPNKTTRDAREAMQCAFDGVGGVRTLTQWANDNLTEFFKIYARLIPAEVKQTGDPSQPVEVRVRFVRDTRV